jgi:ADP-ribose pyrophosphatase
MTLDPNILLRTSRFFVQRISHHGSDGAMHHREVVRHPGSVVILPCLDDNRICLIRNYRVSVDQTLIELPAGTLEEGEEPLQTAFRELIEETGYRADVMTPLNSFYAAPGILDERMHLFAATGLTKGDPRREANEQIENLVITWGEAFDLLRRGEIIDAKTIVGLCLWQFLHPEQCWR